MDKTESNFALAQLLRAQALLLTRRELRLAYRQDRTVTLRRLGLDEATAQQFPHLNADELDTQAQMLIEKRWHEVQKLIALPQGLNQEQCRDLFHDFAESFWPESSHRHELDAVAFARHLHRRGWRVAEEWRLNLLCFCIQKRRLSIHWVRALPVRSRLCSGIQIIYPRAKSAEQFLIYLAV